MCYTVCTAFDSTNRITLKTCSKALDVLIDMTQTWFIGFPSFPVSQWLHTYAHLIIGNCYFKSRIVSALPSLMVVGPIPLEGQYCSSNNLESWNSSNSHIYNGKVLDYQTELHNMILESSHLMRERKKMLKCKTVFKPLVQVPTWVGQTLGNDLLHDHLNLNLMQGRSQS